MNDEIKEILDKWKCYIGLTKKFSNNDMELLRVEDIEKVLDYITNLQQDIEMYAQLKDEYEEEIKDLQQENEYLKKQNDEKTKIGVADHKYASQMEDKVILLQQENERLKTIKPCMLNFQECYVVKDYKSRCEKASEYIKEHQRKDEFLNLNEWQARDLLNILQNGSDSQ